MSRSSTPVPAASALSPSLLLPLMLVLMPRVAAAAAAEIAPASGRCDVKSCALLEASLLEEYVSGLNATGPPDVEVGDATLPPFGALPTDWSRLLMLQNSQPEGTPLRETLLRLSRLVLAAYFDSQEHEWTDQLLTGRHGRGGEAAAGAASEAESEDQQAGNATSGSPAQKGSTRINASTADALARNNGGSQPSGGNFSGNQADPPTPRYSPPPPTGDGANFNRTFSSAADNEASGNESNGTSSPFPDDDASAANEVLHERSREEELRLRLEDGDSSESLSLEFNSTRSVEEFFASAEGGDSLVDEFFATEATTAAETAAPGFFASSEEDVPLTKSVEDFFASAEFGATPSRSVEDFFRSAEATTQGPMPGDPSGPGIAGDSGAAAGIPVKNGDNSTTAMARPISGEVAGDRSVPGRADAAAIPTMPAGATASPVAAENRTSDRPDDLFSESTTTTTTTRRRPGDDWNSTGSIEPASDGGVTPVAVRLRRSIPEYLRRESSSAAATEAQPVPPASGDDSREEEAPTSARNRHQRRARRSKRRTRKRAGAEFDVEGQYPSFDGREPGQALLAEEWSAENSGRSLQ